MAQKGAMTQVWEDDIMTLQALCSYISMSASSFCFSCVCGWRVSVHGSRHGPSSDVQSLSNLARQNATQEGRWEGHLTHKK